MKNQASTMAVVNQPPLFRRWKPWLALAVLLGLVVLVWATDLWLRRGGGMEGRVQGILDGVRREERGMQNQPSRFKRLIYSLPGPLVDLGEWLFPSNWQGDYFYREKLVELGTNAVPVLMRVAETDRSSAVRKVSIQAIGELGVPAVLVVVSKRLICDSAVEVREASAEALGSLGNASALPALKSALQNDTNTSVRGVCIMALVALGGTNVMPELLAASRSVNLDPPLVSKLVTAFNELRDARAVPVLALWLGEEKINATGMTTASVWTIPADPGVWDAVRVEAAAALGGIGNEAAFQALGTRWQDVDDEDLRAAIAAALGATGDRRALPLLMVALNGSSKVKEAAVEGLGNLADPSAITCLTPLLDDDEKDIRAKAAEALGRIGSLESVLELKRLVAKDYAEEVRLSACKALGMLGDVTAAPVIIAALPQLKDGHGDAIWALGHLGDTNSVSAVAAALKDKEREVRFAAAYALVEIGGPAAIETLASQLADKDDFVRYGKACALAMLGQTQSLAAVRIGLREKTPWQRFGAALALIRLGNAVDAKEWDPMLADSSPSLRNLASEAIAGRAMSALTELLRDRDNDLRHYAARGLIFFKNPAPLPVLREACRDSNPEVRNAARVTVRCLERSLNSRK